MSKTVRAVSSAVLPDLLTVEQMADILGLAQNTVVSATLKVNASLSNI